MPLPSLTHLQYLILQALLGGEKSGKDLRRELAKSGEKKSGPAFYQLMARMEDAKFVKGRYDQHMLEGQIIKERRYLITAPGVKAYNQTRMFYLESGTAGNQEGLTLA